LTSSFLERRAAGEAGVDVVPPFEFVAFAHLPAQQDDPSVPERREVDQSALEVLQLDAKSFQFGHLRRELVQDMCIRYAIDDASAALFGGFRGFSGVVAIVREFSMGPLNLRENHSYARKQGVSFLDSE
jgi:hypothetical protein